MTIEITCRCGCGKKFEVTPSRLAEGKGKYYSLECYYKVVKNKIKKTCKCGCGREFYTQPSVNRKYFSKKCYHKSLRKQKIKVTCHCGCGKEFEINQSQVKWGNGSKYYSIKCVARAKTKKITVVCQECGIEFKAPLYKVNKGEAKYHNRSCQDKARSREWSGPNSPFWQGGSSFTPYCFKFNPKFRESVRKHQGYRCALCGHIWQPGEIRLSVHHVHARKDSCCNEESPREFVCLCSRTCHHKTIGKEKYFIPRFIRYILKNFNGQSYPPNPNSPESISEKHDSDEVVKGALK